MSREYESQLDIRMASSGTMYHVTHVSQLVATETGETHEVTPL